MPKSVVGRKAGALRLQLSKAVKTTRERRGLSQQAVATMAGVSPVRVVEIEGKDGATNPRIDTVEKVCGALGIAIRVEAA
jgi:transcriptional regulator with XRE-family HTH domain